MYFAVKLKIALLI